MKLVACALGCGYAQHFDTDVGPREPWTCPACLRGGSERDRFRLDALWARKEGAVSYSDGVRSIEFFSPADPPGPSFGDLSPEQLRMEADRRERAERDDREDDAYGAST